MKELLAACLDAPDDMAPRVVYADWLEEQGHPFAAVVRAKTDDDADELAKPHMKTWFGAIEKWVDGGPMGEKFDRGLLRRIAGVANKYTTKAMQQALLKVVTVFGSRATAVIGKTASLPRCETLAWTTDLDWSRCHADDDRVGALAQSPHVTRLHTLRFDEVACTNAGLRAIAKSPRLARLRTFGLRDLVKPIRFDASGVLAIVEAFPLDGFELECIEELEPVLDSPALATVRQLQLHAVSPRVGMAIAHTKRLEQLEQLFIPYSYGLDDSFADALLKNGALARLRELYVPGLGRSASPAIKKRLEKRFGKLS